MPLKRKSQTLGLERRVRPRKQEDWELEEQSENDFSDDQASEEDVRRQQDYDDDEDESAPEDDDDDEDDDEEEVEEQPAKVDLSSISFGALAKAQASLPPTRRKSKSAATTSAKETTEERPRWERPERNVSRPEIAQRVSKHAPQEQSSKKPVSRRREAVHDNRRKARDPRFDTGLGGTVDASKTRAAYSFLEEYRNKEIADLKAQIKKTKNLEIKEGLKRQLLSMESKKKAQQRKDEEEQLLREHRKKEKDLVAQGKTPFYLKKGEQKKQLLTNRFDKMSKGQVDRAIERKRKKVAGKEKKELDFLTRVRDRH